MKILKTAIAFSILNIIVLSIIVGSSNNIIRPPVQQSIEVSPIPAPASSVTPKPKSNTTKPSSKVVKKTKPTPVSGDINNDSSQTVTSKPSDIPVATQNPSPIADNRCLIQIDGSTYDVSQFRSQHSGGDVFSCGTDMSQIFWSRHNSRILDQMQRYRL